MSRNCGNVAQPSPAPRKELEALEKLVERVGRIDLHATDGQGLDAMLKGLFRLEPAKG